MKSPSPQTEEAARPPLPRTVRLLGWVSFFADVSSEMAYPLLPLFVVGVLGASAASLGGIEGAAAAVVALLTAWAGFKSDERKHGHASRVVFVRWGYGLPVLGKTLLAAAGVWPMALAGRTIDRIGKGLRGSPRDAMIGDATRTEDRGRAFGYHRAMDTAGAFTGVVLSALLLLWLGGFGDSAWLDQTPAGSLHDLERPLRIVLGIAAAMSLASFAITLRLRDRKPAEPADTPEPEPEPKPQPQPEAAPETEPGTPKLRLPLAYWITVLPMLVFALGNSSDTFLLLRASDLGLTPFSVVLVYALFNLSYALASYPAGLLSDRFGRWRVIVIGWVLYAGVYLGFAYTPALGVWGLMPVYGLFAALTDGVGKALISDVSPKARRGTAMGVFYMGQGFAMLIGSVVAGLLWDRVSHRSPFLVGAAFAGLAVVLVPIAARAHRTTTRVG